MADKPQQQTLSVRISESLRARLERVRKLASKTVGGSLLANRPEAAGGRTCKRIASGAGSIEQLINRRLNTGTLSRSSASLRSDHDAVVHVFGLPQRHGPQAPFLWTPTKGSSSLSLLDSRRRVKRNEPSAEDLDAGSGTRDRDARREFLDHVLFWNTRDLERKLTEFPLPRPSPVPDRRLTLNSRPTAATETLPVQTFPPSAFEKSLDRPRTARETEAGRCS
jgi:hypothetical protein